MWGKSKDKLVLANAIKARTGGRGMAPHIPNLENRGESGQIHAPERNPLEHTEQEAAKHKCPPFLWQNMASVTVRWFVGAKVRK
jgi:hypothetical protein